MQRDVLVVHAPGAPWQDLVAELESGPVTLQTVSSLAAAQERIRLRRPDVVVLDTHFEQGVDLLLHARQTASGMLMIAVRRIQGEQGLYDALPCGDESHPIEHVRAPAMARRILDTLACRLPNQSASPRIIGENAGPP
jgi:CheY-like chemotaxis protein